MEQDESDGAWRYQVLFDTRHQVLCNVLDFHKEDLGDPREEVSNRKHRVSTAYEEKAYRFQLKRGLSIGDHTTNYTKFLTDLVNVVLRSKTRTKR